MAGLQCSLRLWNKIYDPLKDDNSEPSSSELERVKIGELARTLFSSGTFASKQNASHKALCEITKTLVNSNETTLFDATFDTGNCRVRVDILDKADPSGWKVYQISSSTSIHDRHIASMAYQVHVLSSLGINIQAACIIHINSKYRHKNPKIVATEFFNIVDVTDSVNERLAQTETLINLKLESINTQSAPKINPGNFCKSPMPCEFKDRCHATLPKDWTGKLPRIKQAQLEKYSNHGIISISKIPDDMCLSGIGEQIRISHKTGKPFISGELKRRLIGFGPPAYHLDFESIMPAIPLYTDTSPYQHIPFMFSLHLIDGNSLTHQDFIGFPANDPRRDLALSLIRMTENDEFPIVVYSHYEKRILGELARDFPELETPLLRLISRLKDLYQLVQKSIYFPKFYGSFSIKHVAPALVPYLNYSDLEIKNGAMAANSYQNMVYDSRIGKIENSAIMQRLSSIRQYCKRDTLATVEIWKYLNSSI